MQHFIFNLRDGDRDRARALLRAKWWIVGGDERHRDALGVGDLVLVFVARTREFVGRAVLKSGFLDPVPADPSASCPLASGVLLDEVDDWTRGVPLAAAVLGVDPHGANPSVQANAAGFRAGVVQITPKEYDIVLELHAGG
jgi:hypothetical protein